MIKQAGTAATEREDRESQSRPVVWAPPSLLDAPLPPPGIRYRWVRTRVHADDDPGNISKRMARGYTVVRRDEIAKDWEGPTIEHGTYAGVVGVNDVILMQCSEEMAQAREAYYQKKSHRAQDAVNAELARHSHPSMPITQEHRSFVTHGDRRPDFQEE